jgi:hypothetical protein
MINGVELAAGQRWRNRQNKVVTIEDNPQHSRSTYPFSYRVTANDVKVSLTKDGRYLYGPVNHDSIYDLIELVSLPFKIGQLWKNCLGDTIKIVKINTTELTDSPVIGINVTSGSCHIGISYKMDGLALGRSLGDLVSLIPLADVKLPLRDAVNKQIVTYVGETTDDKIAVFYPDDPLIHLVSLHALENYKPDQTISIRVNVSVNSCGEILLAPSGTNDHASIDSVIITYSPDDGFNTQEEPIDGTERLLVNVIKTIDGRLAFVFGETTAQVVDSFEMSWKPYPTWKCFSK